MKQIFLFLLIFTLYSHAQDKKISVVSVEKANIVYRGITNPIKIAVPGAKSFQVDAPGTLEKVDSFGNYLWNVTTVTGIKGLIKIDAVLYDNSIIHEEKEFEIRVINPIKTILKGRDLNQKSIELRRDEIINAKIELKRDDFTLNIPPPEIKSLQVYFPGKETIIVYGNKLDTIVANKLEEVNNGEHLIIQPSTEYHIRIQPIDIIVLGNDIKLEPVSLRYQNFVYRGIDNELEITVPQAKSFKVSAPGLTDQGSGKYRWNVTQISTTTTTLDFEIITENDSLFHTKKEFYVRDVPKMIATLNTRGCDKCIVELAKNDVKEAKIGVSFRPDLDVRLRPMRVKQYTLVLPEGYTYTVYEDKFSDTAQKMILQYPVGTIFKITDIDYTFCGYGPRQAELKFMLVD